MQARIIPLGVLGVLGMCLTLSALGGSGGPKDHVKIPKAGKLSPLPLDFVFTINETWGYVHHDQHVATSKDMIHALVKAAGRNTNIMFDVGLKPDGQLPPECQQRIGELNQWLSRYGESLFGTRSGPGRPQPWGVTTYRDDRIYVHVLEGKPGQSMSLWGTSGKFVDSVRLLKDGSKIPYALDTFMNIVIRLPDELDPIDTIIVVELKMKA